MDHPPKREKESLGRALLPDCQYRREQEALALENGAQIESALITAVDGSQLNLGSNKYELKNIKVCVITCLGSVLNNISS